MSPEPPLHPDLKWVVDVLWPSADVSLDGGSGAEETERYTVVQWRGRPRFLIPTGSSRVARSSLLTYNGLRPPGMRAARRAVATVLRLPSTMRPLPTLSIHVPRERSIASRLADIFGRDDLVAAIGIPPVGPNRKPVLQVFSRAGKSMGYVKLGWSSVTRERVARESEGLRLWKDKRGRITRVPELTYSGDWHGLEASVTAPLPPTAKAYTGSSPPPILGMLDVIEVGDRSTSTLAGSGYLDALLRRMERIENGDEGILGAARSLASVLSDRHGELELSFAVSHGDWVPWNLARDGDALYVFDWEHWSPQAPVGLDLVHWHFQIGFVLLRLPLNDAIKRAEVESRTEIEKLGVREALLPVLARLLLVELAVRAQEGVNAGAPPNPRFHPHAADVLEAAGNEDLF